MNFKESWLSIFPDWPPELLDKFEIPILMDLAKYTGEDPMGWAGWWSSVVSYAAQGNYRFDSLGWNTETNFGFSLLNPTNQKYLNTARWDVSFWYATLYGLGWFSNNAPPTLQTNFNQNMHYEQRIWINLHVYMNYDSRLYYPNFAWNYATIGTLTGTHQQSNGLWTDNFADYWSYLIVAPNASATPYDGASTIMALYENGVPNPSADYNVLADFIDFRNAYLKYGNQIAAQKNALMQQQKIDLADYQNELADKIQAEKNSLQNLTLTMQQAMRNEAASAERDMVNTVINAQNLKLSLMAAINGR